MRVVFGVVGAAITLRFHALPQPPRCHRSLRHRGARWLRSRLAQRAAAQSTANSTRNDLIHEIQGLVQVARGRERRAPNVT